MNSILNRNGGAGLGHDIVNFVKNIKHFESTSRKRPNTWPRNKTENYIVRDTMGYQIRRQSA
jgi:hypothetical protein